MGSFEAIALRAFTEEHMPESAQRPFASLSEAVRAERVRTVYRQSIALSLVNPVNAAVVTVVLWSRIRYDLLLGWLAAMAGVSICRILLSRRYLRAAPPIAETSLWARRFVWGAAGSGILWGAAGVLFFDSRFLSQVFVIFVIGGMVAGASGTLALHMPAFLAFTASAILPTAARVIWEHGPQWIGMGALALIYGVAMTLVAKNINLAVGEAFQLRFKNQALVEELSAAQVALADVNRTLEQRVAERGLALEKQSEALRDAQRMESIGLLAGGVAHDFNNLLTVVLGNVERLQDSENLLETDRKSLEEILNAATRGAVLVSQLLAFSRRQVVVPRILDINGVVSDLQTLIVRLIGENIEVKLALHPSALHVNADATQLQQVIINLATNARDAMPAGGTLTIETAPHQEKTGAMNLPEGPYVVLCVRDTGKGMDHDTQRMVFHPFFTTKQLGHGSGLGLATVHGIVEQSGGRVVVESEPGKGSCFRIFLPSVASAVPEAVAPVVAAALAERGQAFLGANVLLVEDEAAVRELTALSLGASGFRVIEAENGEQALEIVRSRQHAIDLLITDVVMPKIGGVELARLLRHERPDLRVLLVSGYSPEQMPAIDDSIGISFLQKPYTRAELLDRVSRLLATPDSARRATGVSIQQQP